MNIDELERQIRSAFRRLKSMETAAGKELSPADEVSAEIRSAILAMREVLNSGKAIQSVVKYTPALQAAQAADPGSAFGSVQNGDYQDVISIWPAFEAWLDQSIDVVDVTDGKTVLRRVTPRELIQRRGQIYPIPAQEEFTE